MKKAKISPPKIVTRKHLARAQRERTLTRWVLIGTAMTLVAVLGLIGAGLFAQYVLQPRQPVARVGDVAITTADFQKAVRYQRVFLTNQLAYYEQLSQFFADDPNLTSQMQQIQFQLQNPTSIGSTVLNELIDDENIRQEAARRGISVSPEELQESIHTSFNFYANGTPTPTVTPTPGPTDTATPTPDPTLTAALTPTASPTVTPTLEPSQTPTAGPSPTPAPTSTPFPSATPVTAEGFQELFRERIDVLNKLTGMTEADLRRLYETQLLREKLAEAITAEVPRDEEQLHARHILVADEALAKEIADRARAGEDFAALAAQYSTDDGNKDEGGDLGWFGPGAMVPPFEEMAYETPVGEISDPVQTQFGWHVIQVLERRMEPLDDAAFEQKRTTAFQDWLAEKRAGAEVETFESWVDRVPEGPTDLDIQAVQQELETDQPEE